MRFLHVVPIIVAVFTLYLGAKPKPVSVESGKLTVTGTIFPSSINRDGHPTSFFLSVVPPSAPDSTIEYEIISSDNKNENLVRLIYQTIEANCHVSIGKNGKLSLSILSFKVLENRPEDIEEEF